MYTLQHSVLLTFRKILILLPSSLDVFRAEGAWDFIFSENLFYYGPTAVEFSGDNCSSSEGFIMRSRQFSGFTGNDGHISSNEVEVLQVEAISFLELAATLSGISHNLVGSFFLCGSHIKYFICYFRFYRFSRLPVLYQLFFVPSSWLHGIYALMLEIIVV